MDPKKNNNKHCLNELAWLKTSFPSPSKTSSLYTPEKPTRDSKTHTYL